MAQQPRSEDERRQALEALHACPVHAIGQRERDPLTAAVLASFPVALTPDIYFCGFANEATFGAASYFIRRDGGNVLVDIPRFFPKLVANLEALGGVQFIFLTHRDDIAGHDKFAAHFRAERIMHTGDNPPAGIEKIITGDAAIEWAHDLKIIPTPDHTRGSMCLLYANETLFSGDHLAGNSKGGLTSFRDACWYSWEKVKESNERLLDLNFLQVFPGHGRRYLVKDITSMRNNLRQLIERM